MPRKPLRLRLLQQPQRGGDIAIRRGPVQQQHIHLIHLQIPQALLDRGQEFIRAIIVGLHLGGDAKLIPREPGGLQRRPGIGLIAIHLCGVKRAVAHRDRRRNRLRQNLALQRKGSERALVGLLKTDVHRVSKLVAIPADKSLDGLGRPCLIL